MQIEQIARICHEANKALCESVNEFSQRSWEDAEEWQRESAVKGVQFALANPNAPASAQHDAWMADKIAQGWEWGAEKDSERKTHPCLVSFEQLPPEQQAKDHLFKAVVHALAPFVANGD
jgi:hypothetical protein